MRSASFPFAAAPLLFAVGVGVTLLASACSSSSSGGTSNAPLTCTSPGGPTPGAADAHCGGVPSQSVDQASCLVNDAGLGGGG
ncbi:MAG: hypothetical protein ABI461_14900, partial [Polyangiaceae bacterium]